mmetsp:Transcript_46937/g.102045  ORF Transcript_46937/g.102045 Transcript_46937/m.102045 type:complete len:222 (+) Transcript_46937:372-1037(+)
MRQGQSPDPQVRCSVRHGAKHELDGLDDLMNEDLPELELLAMTVPTVTAGNLDVKELIMITMLPLFGIVLCQQQEGLGEQHQRHRYDRSQHQCLGHLHRTMPERELVLLSHGHADERVDDARWSIQGAVSADRVDPLVENHDVHPSEEAEHEDHHGHTLKHEVDRVLGVEGVRPLEAHTHKHLEHTEQYGQLHLHRVHKEKLVAGSVPCRIKAKRIRPWQR